MVKGWEQAADYSASTKGQRAALYRWANRIDEIIKQTTKIQADEMLRLFAEVVSPTADANDIRADEAIERMKRKHGDTTA